MSINRLRSIPLFADFAEADLAVMERHLARRRYRRNTVLIEKGDETDSLYLVLDGEVEVYIMDERSGKELILNTHGPGEYFGELAMLLKSPRTASVRTIADSEFFVIGKQWFREFILAHPDIAYTLVLTLAQRVSDLTREVSSLALDTVYERVRNLLLSEATAGEDDERVIGRITQQHIANRIGASREMVSRILKDLKTGGYISLDNKEIVIHKDLPAEW